MDTYCEKLKNGNYNIQEITEEVLVQLINILEQLEDHKLMPLWYALRKEHHQLPERYFDMAWNEIELCEPCHGSGKRKNHHPILHGEFEMEECKECDGEGSLLKSTFVKYEIMNEEIRKKLAR